MTSSQQVPCMACVCEACGCRCHRGPVARFCYFLSIPFAIGYAVLCAFQAAFQLARKS